MKMLYEGIIFLIYMVICGGLMESRFSKKVTLLLYGIMAGSVFLIQAALLFWSQDLMLVLTMLPLTAYLPYSMGLYFMTSYGFFQMSAVWVMGFLGVFMLRIVQKIFKWYLCPRMYDDISWLFLLLLTVGLLVFLVYKFLRKPFQGYMKGNQAGWLMLCFPVLMSYLLLSYFSDSAVSGALLILVLLTVLSIFLMVIWIVNSQAVVSSMKESEQKMRFRMQMQRQEYEDICKRMEAGRVYRHDMRHHLSVLKGLAVHGNSEEILKYIENMGGQLSETERKMYCANSTVNAVFSVYLAQAKEEHCTCVTEIGLPEVIPFDEMDVCMVIANAMENAIHACREIAEEKRRIHVSVELIDHRKLFISIKNPCTGLLCFDDEGIPISTGEEGHGIGLKSIHAITDKYKGFFQCKCEEGEFCFHAAMFGGQQAEVPVTGKKVKLWKKMVATIPVFIFAVIIYVNCVPAVAQAFMRVSEEGWVARLIQEYSWKVRWGDTSMKVEYPVLEGDTSLTGQATFVPQESSAVQGSGTGEVNSAVQGSGTGEMDSAVQENGAEEISFPVWENGMEEMNWQIEEYIKQVKEQFRQYVSRKYEGYVGGDTTWEILRDDDRLLSIRMETTINVGGSLQYSRCYTLDKTNGKILGLQDLFLSDSDYIGVISEEILRQMKEQVQNNEANYFIPGGIWADDECFKQIAEDQNFYLNDQDQLVIIFDEYEVAPGNMGMPEFILDNTVLEDILRQPSAFP